jgi:hypothetical protein
MMRALEAGGLPALTDRVRGPDVDNPFGYYEFEPAKRLNADMSWLTAAQGRAVKMVYALLYVLPTGYEYRVVLMRRDIDEVIASQTTMLQRMGRHVHASTNAELRTRFSEQLARCQDWIRTRPNFRMLSCDYRAVVTKPYQELGTVSAFLGNGLDVASMVACVDPALYRERRG